MLDINMMLVGGFGFLMTFLKKFGFSALGLTLLVVVFCTEWSVLLWGLTKLDATFTIKIAMMELECKLILDLMNVIHLSPPLVFWKLA
jgi:hypothetical protein